jgi:hypothetical protein
MGGTPRNGTRHQPAHAVAHETTHLVHRVFRHAVRAHRIIHACRQVAKRVEQRPVKVEYVSIVLSHGCQFTTFKSGKLPPLNVIFGYKGNNNSGNVKGFRNNPKTVAIFFETTYTPQAHFFEDKVLKEAQ